MEHIPTHRGEVAGFGKLVPGCRLMFCFHFATDTKQVRVQTWEIKRPKMLFSMTNIILSVHSILYAENMSHVMT